MRAASSRARSRTAVSAAVPGSRRDADVQTAEREQGEADALGLAEEGEVALGLDGAGGIERSRARRGRPESARWRRALRWRERRTRRCAPVRRRAGRARGSRGGSGARATGRAEKMVCSMPPASASSPGRERLAEGGGRRGGEDDQRDQGDGCRYRRGWGRGHQQAGGEGADGFQQRWRAGDCARKGVRRKPPGRRRGRR